MKWEQYTCASQLSESSTTFKDRNRHSRIPSRVHDTDTWGSYTSTSPCRIYDFLLKRHIVLLPRESRLSSHYFVYTGVPSYRKHRYCRKIVSSHPVTHPPSFHRRGHSLYVVTGLCFDSLCFGPLKHELQFLLRHLFAVERSRVQHQ